jgi:hypothetical protein
MLRDEAKASHPATVVKRLDTIVPEVWSSEEFIVKDEGWDGSVNGDVVVAGRGVLRTELGDSVFARGCR